MKKGEKKKKKSNEKPQVNIKKLQKNYNLTFDYDGRLQAFIKSLPKEHRKIFKEVSLLANGKQNNIWIHQIREIQMGNIISFLLDNSYPFVLENFTKDEVQRLRGSYLNRQKRIRAALKAKADNIEIEDCDWGFMKIEPYDYQKQAIKFMEINDGNIMLGDEPGVGKQAPLHTLISTPEGWVKMGDLKIGSKIHNRFGGVSSVKEIFPQGIKDCYKVTFDDNSHTECGLEHLWSVRTKEDKEWTTKTLKEIIDSGIKEKKEYNIKNALLKWEIPVTEPVFYEEQELAINPYFFGASFGSTGIPDLYKKSSKEQRVSLLRGIMDKNGFLNKCGANYKTKIELLADDVVELVQSLGGIAKKSIKTKNKGNDKVYNVNIKTPFNPFAFSKKALKYQPKEARRFIKKIEYTGKLEQQCIMVDSPDNTYLTDYFIVTHNTFPSFAYAVKHQLKTLVICPASLKLNWKSEIEKFSNEKAHVFKYKPTKKSGKINHPKEDSLFHIINFESIKSYIKIKYKHKCGGTIIVNGKQKKCGCEIISITKKIKDPCPECENINSFKTRYAGLQYIIEKDDSFLDPEDYELLIIDEFHRIKEKDTDWTKIISKAFGETIKKKVLLSGTAIKSRPIEIFMPLNLLDKERWNSYHEFGVKYCAAFEDTFGWKYDGASNLEELYERISSFYLRRLKKDVLTQLPPKTYTEINLELDAKTKREYNAALKEMRTFLNEKGEEQEEEMSFLAKIHKLKKCTETFKLEQAREFVDDIIKSKDKVVIFFDYIDTGNKIKELWGSKAVIHTGQMNASEKQNAVSQFQENKDVHVFAGTFGSAGVGITLTAANKLIMIGQPWTPSDVQQAEDRVHRASTKQDNVQIITFLCEDTVDIEIYNLLRDKKQILSKLMDNKDYKSTANREDASILSRLYEMMN